VDLSSDRLLMNELPWVSSPTSPDRVRGPPSPLFHGYLGSFTGVKRPKRKANHSLRLRMSGTISSHPIYASTIYKVTLP
jgi:hypothetical protein